MTTKEQIVEKVSSQKRKGIIRLYMDGTSYDEIAREADVSNSDVGYVILKLKTGQYPEYTGLLEDIEILRKLTLKLRQLRVVHEPHY